jgi:hypothetical protein
MNRKSQDYLKSSYDDRCYGDDSYTTVKRDFAVDGKSKDYVRDVAHHIKMTVMP